MTSEQWKSGRQKALLTVPETYGFLDPVTVVTPPENYTERRVPMFTGASPHL
jgi:hypothetical protein